jgi:hypothetical protein
MWHAARALNAEPLARPCRLPDNTLVPALSLLRALGRLSGATASFGQLALDIGVAISVILLQKLKCLFHSAYCFVRVRVVGIDSVQDFGPNSSGEWHAPLKHARQVPDAGVELVVVIALQQVPDSFDAHIGYRFECLRRGVHGIHQARIVDVGFLISLAAPYRRDVQYLASQSIAARMVTADR